MRRILLNTLALSAIMAGGLTLTNAPSAQEGAFLTGTDGPKCGVCSCESGQKCRKFVGGCECY